MAYITITEFRRKFSHYLDIAQREDVFVTKNKKVIVVLSNPKEVALKNLLNLKGCMKDFDDGRDYKDIIGDVIVEKEL